MHPLTEYVQQRLQTNDPDTHELYVTIRNEISDSCHIEHILSQISDLIAVSGRTKTAATSVGTKTFLAEQLRSGHSKIIEEIGNAVRYGYRPAKGDKAEEIGTRVKPIVCVDFHRAFVRQVFASREKPGFKQTPISFFTTNYDTLIEDALALEGVPYADGFLGGAMAFWSPACGYGDKDNQAIYRAKIYKLHGSVDWHRIEDGRVVRCRDGCGYPSRVDNLLIHPQATKYLATQKDPFAALFSRFRTALATGPDIVLGICGYSFGDEHVNGEIEAAMSSPQSKAVIVTFSEEKMANGKSELQGTLKSWLCDAPWRERIIVATNRGLYHGNLENLCPPDEELEWWNVEGLTKYLSDGPETLPTSNPPLKQESASKSTFEAAP